MRTTTLIPLAMLAMRLHGQVGLLDNSFSGDGKATFNAGGDTEASAVVIQPDGKILVAGSGGDPNVEFVVARYLPDGTLDPSFGGDGIVTKGLPGEDRATCIALQPDGKILVGGYYTLSASQFMAVVRLNEDGSPDTGFFLNGQNYISFDSETPTHAKASGLAVQVDGRIVVCGSTDEGDNMNTALARFNEDGSLDATFGPNANGKVVHDTYGIGSPDEASAVAIQSDGKIVLAGHGHFGSYREACLTRYLIDGTMDPSFGDNGEHIRNLSTGDNVVTGLCLRPNGTILVGGIGDQQFIAARLEPNGNEDVTFGNGLWPYDGSTRLDFPVYGGEAYAIAVQSDGRILLAGTFLDAGAPSDLAIARLTAEGQPDNTFGNGGWQDYDLEGLVDHGAGMALQSDGKIVVVGKDFSIPTKGSVIRVLNDVGIGMPEAPVSDMGMTVFPNPSSGHTELRYTLSRSGKVSCYLLEITGRRVSTAFSNVSRSAGTTVEQLDLEELPAGTYLVELRTEEGVSRTPIVKR